MSTPFRLATPRLVGLALMAAGVIGMATVVVFNDGVPPAARSAVQSEPTLALRIAKAFDADPDGWTTDHYTARWRGGVTLWIANGKEYLGHDPAYSSFYWPAYDHRFDQDRDLVWEAYTGWKDHQLASANAAAFAKLGPPPAAPSPTPADAIPCQLNDRIMCIMPDGHLWVRVQ